MIDHGEFERWRIDAAQALVSARVQSDAGLHNWSCFAAEQSVQLALKGLLHGLGKGAWGHDLVALASATAEAVGSTWEPNRHDALLRLSRHYIPARYPDAHAGAAASQRYGSADSDQAIHDADAILVAVDALWARLVEESSDEA